MIYKPHCVKCGKRYETKETGVGVVEYLADGSLYRIWCADLLECPKCHHQITWGYGEATHASAEPEKVKHEIEYYKLHTRLIKVY